MAEKRSVRPDGASERQAEPADMLRRRVDDVEQAPPKGGSTCLRKSDLLTVVAHELRNAAGLILGTATTLRLQSGDADVRDELVASLERGVRRLVGLVDRVVAASRLETGGFDPWPHVVDVPAAVKRVLDEAWPSPVGVELSCADGMHVVVDPDHLHHVLVNLLWNAMHHGAPPFEIDVGKSGDRVAIRVRDHGPGVAPVLVESLFERWAERSTGGHRRGLGVGLFVVKTLVEANGGAVWYSPAVGGGACFELRLPGPRVLPRPEDDAASPQRAGRARGAGGVSRPRCEGDTGWAVAEVGEADVPYLP